MGAIGAKTKIMGDKTKTNFIPVKYVTSDEGPYKVNFSIKKDDTTSKISVLSVAQILSRNQYKDVVDYDKNSRRVITVSFMTIDSANKSTSDDELKKLYDVYIPNSFVFVSGFIFAGAGIDRHGDDGLISQIKHENDNIASIKECMWTDADGVKTPTQKLAITFRKKKLPSHIIAYHSVQKVFAFINKVKHCKKCLRFNHFERDCKSTKQLCRSCGSDEHEQCEKIFCKVCKSDDHSVNDEKCPALLKEKKISKIMSVNNVGYHEAKKQLRTTNYFSALENEEAFPSLPNPSVTYAQKLKEKIKQKVVAKPKITVTPRSRAERYVHKPKSSAMPTEKPVDPLAGPSYNIDLSHLQAELQKLKNEDFNHIMASLLEHVKFLVEEKVNTTNRKHQREQDSETDDESKKSKCEDIHMDTSQDENSNSS